MKSVECNIGGVYWLEENGERKAVHLGGIETGHLAYAVVTGDAVFPWLSKGYISRKLRLYSRKSDATVCLNRFTKRYLDGRPESRFKHAKVVTYVVL